MKLMPEFSFLRRIRPVPPDQHAAGTPKKKRWLAGYRPMNLLPLLVVVLCVFALRLYLALTDPVLRAIDPWWWAPKIESYAHGLSIERIYEPLAPGGWGPIVYPRGYPVLSALIALATGTSGYEVVRFYPVISALNLVPMYFLSFLISKSHRVATITIILVTISKWYSIRTSIGGAECFTHFWLVFSLVFLLLLRDQPTRRNIAAGVFFVTATVLFWHYPIAIYAVFLPFLAIASLGDRRYCKRLLFVALMSTLAAGFLWYFWAQPLQWDRMARGLGVYSFFSAPGIPLDLVGSWGLVLLFLGSFGFLYVLAVQRSRKDPSKIFLVTYFVSVLVLVAVSSRLGWLGMYYGFSSLALPLAVFGAIGLVTAVDATAIAFEKHTAASPRPLRFAKTRWTQILAVVFILIVMLANSSPANYMGETAYSGWYQPVYYDQIVGGHMNGFSDPSSRWIAMFQYGKAFDAPSNDLYYALRWIRDSTSKRSCVTAFLLRPPPSALCPSPDKPCPYSVLRGAITTISERSLIEGMEFRDVLTDSLGRFAHEILSTCGGDVFVVIGIHSWNGDEWGDAQLESLIVSYTTRAPNAISEVYFMHEVHVFHIAQGTPPLSTNTPCPDVRLTSGDPRRIAVRFHVLLY